jgi:hypothetical protein
MRAGTQPTLVDVRRPEAPHVERREETRKAAVEVFVGYRDGAWST